jgi:hypothetical protein
MYLILFRSCGTKLSDYEIVLVKLIPLAITTLDIFEGFL